MPLSGILARVYFTIVLGVIYHSTGNREPENFILREHIQKNLDSLLNKQPNALVIITGDFNPKSTGFEAKFISQANHLKQLVTFNTRDSGILDWFFTNKPKLFTVSQLPKIASSDHYTILAKPASTPMRKLEVNKIKTRDLRDSAWRALGRWMTQKDWSPILTTPSCEGKFVRLMTELNTAIEIFLLRRVVRKHPTDRPWITTKIKRWIRRRQSAFIHQGKNSTSYRHWRNRVQRGIKAG